MRYSVHSVSGSSGQELVGKRENGRSMRWQAEPPSRSPGGSGICLCGRKVGMVGLSPTSRSSAWSR